MANSPAKASKRAGSSLRPADSREGNSPMVPAEMTGGDSGENADYRYQSAIATSSLVEDRALNAGHHERFAGRVGRHAPVKGGRAYVDGLAVSVSSGLRPAEVEKVQCLLRASDGFRNAETDTHVNRGEPTSAGGSDKHVHFIEVLSADQRTAPAQKGCSLHKIFSMEADLA